MPPKKGKGSKKRSPRNSEEEDIPISQIDIQYNPDIVVGLLDELAQHVELKCAQIQKDSDFLSTSIQQAFHLELIKLPTQVKQMSVKRFKEEFGFSLEAVTKGAMVGGSAGLKSSHITVSSTKEHRMSQQFYQTPANKAPGGVSKIMRHPREGEKLLSKNGSPLGEFSTVKKAGKGVILSGGSDTQIDGHVVTVPPPTPGVYLPLKNGEIIDVTEGDIDLESLGPEEREETLQKMQEVMNNMQVMMSKLTNPALSSLAPN